MISNDEGRIPTTDEMDETTPEERYKLVMLCLGCAEWHWFTGARDRFTQSQGERCRHCGSGRFTELRSQRTWDEAWAKRTAAKLKKKLKK